MSSVLPFDPILWFSALRRALSPPGLHVVSAWSRSAALQLLSHSLGAVLAAGSLAEASQASHHHAFSPCRVMSCPSCSLRRQAVQRRARSGKGREKGSAREQGRGRGRGRERKGEGIRVDKVAMAMQASGNGSAGEGESGGDGNAAGAMFLGSQISLISSTDNRWEGALHDIDTVQSNIVLRNGMIDIHG